MFTLNIGFLHRILILKNLRTPTSTETANTKVESTDKKDEARPNNTVQPANVNMQLTNKSASTNKPQVQTSNHRAITRSRSSQPPDHEPPRKKHKQELHHPYTQKIDTKMGKLHSLLKGIFELADNNLIVAQRDMGINDYDMQYCFASKLEQIGKELVQLSNDCTTQASLIGDKIQHNQDNKHNLQPLHYVQEVVKDSLKVTEARQPNQKDFIRDETVLIKREHYPFTISDDETDGEQQEPFSGDMDTKFKYTKKNSNEELLHNYNCEDCNEVFRDTQEFRNHVSNHHKELYHCMLCNTVCRSV